MAREQERVMVDINHGPGGSSSDVLLVSKLAKNFKRWQITDVQFGGLYS